MAPERRHGSLEEYVEDVLITVKPDVKGVLDAVFQQYAEKTYVLESVDGRLYRVRLDDMPGFMSVVQRGMRRGLIREVYIRPQQEVAYTLEEISEHPDMPESSAVIVWDDDPHKDGKPGRVHLTGWRVSPPTYTLQELLTQSYHANA